jgi:hypothetical protein
MSLPPPSAVLGPSSQAQGLAHKRVNYVSPNPESAKLTSVFLHLQVLVDAGLKRPQDASKFGQEELAELLQEGGYTHYMTQTAQRLKQAAEEIAGSPHKTVADLRDIEDPKALEREVQKLHGAGPSTAILFLRWVTVWVNGDLSVSFGCEGDNSSLGALMRLETRCRSCGGGGHSTPDVRDLVELWKVLWFAPPPRSKSR